MAWLLSNRDGGLTDEQGHYRFQTNVWSGNVIGDGLQVTQNSPLGMSVIIGPGDARVPYGGYAYTAWNDDNVTATISTANPSNPRIDRLVLYIDRAEAPQQVNPNNPGIPKHMVVAGTPGAIPSRPSNAAVNSAVGATNPWIDLADIRVNAGVTQITNANITRTAVGIASRQTIADSYGTSSVAGTTTSTSYTASLTGGDSASVTIAVPDSGIAEVSFGVEASVNSTSQTALASVSVSGSNNIAASDDIRIQPVQGSNNNFSSASRTVVFRNLNQGVTTFSVMFRVTGATGSFRRPWIVVKTFA